MSKNAFDPLAQFGQEFPLELRMALQPRSVARGRVRQRNEFWGVFSPPLSSLSHRTLAAAAKKVTLSVLSDEQCQVDLRQPGEQFIEPQLRALSTRRQISAIASAWIAIPHRNDRDARFIVKDFLADAHPAAQTFSARVVPRNTRVVHTQAGCLPYYEDLSRCGGAQYWTWTERKGPFTHPAIAHGYQQLVERRIF